MIGGLAQRTGGVEDQWPWQHSYPHAKERPALAAWLGPCLRRSAAGACFQLGGRQNYQGQLAWCKHGRARAQAELASRMALGLLIVQSPLPSRKAALFVVSGRCLTYVFHQRLPCRLPAAFVCSRLRQASLHRAGVCHGPGRYIWNGPLVALTLPNRLILQPSAWTWAPHLWTMQGRRAQVYHHYYYYYYQ